MKNAEEYMEYLVRKGGPEPKEYRKTDKVIQTFMENLHGGDLGGKSLEAVWDTYGEAFTPVTMQGFAMRKPHGYSGDFEIIDRIYTKYLAPKHLEKWDYYFHDSSGAKAVRNRKEYFINILSSLDTKNAIRHVLNIGSGPARDLKEFFTQKPNSNIHVDCVDNDPNSILYAKKITEKYTNKITFHLKNILRFKPEYKYDLIWSAGLFDYFTDKMFKFCIKRFLQHLKPNGCLVIGNFSTANPSRDYMEFGGWILNHRSVEMLENLALSCNITPENISIHSEAEGVNLFLHIKKVC